MDIHHQTRTSHQTPSIVWSCKRLGHGSLRRFGEASPDLHRFLDLLSRKGAASRHRDLGCDTPLQARAHVKNRCCRELGVAAVRAAALHKLQALATVLVGKDGAAKQAGRRRSSKSTHQARADCYFNQHSFYADDLPRRRRPRDL